MLSRFKFVAVALFSVIVAATSVAAPVPASAQDGSATTPLTECPWLTDPVVRLYQAYFLRAPDQDGFDFWVGRVEGGQSLDDISDFFSMSTEFGLLYGDKTNAEFVGLIYENVLGRTPDQEGFDFWTGQLDQELMTRGRVMRNFSESQEYVAKTGTNVPAAGYFSAFPSDTVMVCGLGPQVVPYTVAPASWFTLLAPPVAGGTWKTFVHPIDNNGGFLGNPAPSLQENDVAAFRLHLGFMPVAGNFLQITVADDQLWSVVLVPGKFSCDALTEAWAGNPCGLQ